MAVSREEESGGKRRRGAGDAPCRIARSHEESLDFKLTLTCKVHSHNHFRMPAMTLVAVAPTPIKSRLAVLHHLLDESLQLGPEYEEGMASHLPMALAALDGLGAGEAQMRVFYAHYAQRLERAPATGTLDVVDSPTADWMSLRGRIDAFAALRRHFGAALSRDGREAVLRDALPALIDGAPVPRSTARSASHMRSNRRTPANSQQRSRTARRAGFRCPSRPDPTWSSPTRPHGSTHSTRTSAAVRPAGARRRR
jgi:hypothetical protein